MVRLACSSPSVLLVMRCVVVMIAYSAILVRGADEEGCPSAPTGTVVVRSNRSVAFTNCTTLHRVQLGDSSSWVAEDVALLIQSATMQALPAVQCVFGVMDAVRRVSITLRDLTVDSGGVDPQRTVAETMLHSLLSCSAKVIENVSIHVVNCRISSKNNTIAAGPGLIDVDGTQMVAHVSVRVVNATWSGYMPRNRRFLSVVSSGGDVRHVTVDLLDSRFAFDMPTGLFDGWMTFAAANTSGAVVVRVTSCSVSMRVVCLVGDSCDEAAIFMFHLPVNGSSMEGIRFYAVRSTLLAYSYYDPAYDHDGEYHSMVLSVMRLSGDFEEVGHRVTGLTVAVEHSEIAIHAKIHAAVFKILRCDLGLHDVAIALSNTACELTATGIIGTTHGSRLTDLLYLSDSAPPHNATIVVEDVRVQHRLTGGMDARNRVVVGGSRLLLVGADCIAIGTTGAGVRIHMRRVVSTVAIANGTMTCLNDGKGLVSVAALCLMGPTVGATMLRLTPPESVITGLVAELTDLVLTVVAIHFDVAETNAFQVLGVASYHAAVVCVSANTLSNLTLVLHNTTMVVEDASIAMSATTIGKVRDASFVFLVQMQPAEGFLTQLLEQFFGNAIPQSFQETLSSGMVSLSDSLVNVSNSMISVRKAMLRNTVTSPNVALQGLPSISHNVRIAYTNCAFSIDHASTSSDRYAAVVTSNPAAVMCFVNCSLDDGSMLVMDEIAVPCLFRVTDGANALLSNRATVTLTRMVVSGARPAADDAAELAVLDVANEGSTLAIAASSVLRIERCAFVSLDQLVGSSAQRGGALINAGGALVLGCNLWDDAPFPSRTSAPQLQGAALRAMLAMAADSLNDEWGCAAPVFSTSVTESIPLASSPPIAPAYSPAFTPPAAAVAAAAMASPMDGALLIAFGQSACAPAALKASTSAAQFLLSPMHALGEAAAALGNYGIVAAVVLAHYGAVRGVAAASAKRAPPERSRSATTTTHHTTPLLSDPWARVRFPNFSIAFGLFFAPGTAFFTTRLLSSHSGGGAVLGRILPGLVSCALFLVLCCLWWRLEQRVLRRTMHFERYRAHVIRSIAWVPRWVLPTGRWGGTAARHKYGRLRGFARRGYEPYALLPHLVRIVSSAMLGIHLDDAWWWCPVQATLLSLLALGAVFVCVVVKPARVTLVGRMLSVLYALQVCMYVSSALAAGGVGATATQNAAVDVATVCSILYSIASVLKTTHAVLLMAWERARQQAASCVAPEPTAAPVSQRDANGAAMRMKQRHKRMLHAATTTTVVNRPTDVVPLGVPRDHAVVLQNLRAIIELAVASRADSL